MLPATKLLTPKLLILATCAAAFSWAVVDQIVHKKPSMLGAASGAVAGLVAITPASGFAARSHRNKLQALVDVVDVEGGDPHPAIGLSRSSGSACSR